MTVHVPDIGRVLPVYVADTYEGFDAKPFPELTDAELDHYIAANVEAVRAAPEPDVALANHLVMGPLILARAGVSPYAVKIHGSALEYTVRPNRERFLPYALEGIRGAAGVLVGSQHTANSLFEVLADEPSLPERTRLGPPGVDVHEFRPREPDLEQLASVPPAAWGGEQGTAGGAARARPLAGPDRELRGEADRLEGRGPAARRLAAGRGPRARRAPRRGRLRHLLRRAGALRGGAQGPGRGRPEGDRRARPRAGGRAAGRAPLPERVPRHGRRRVAGGGPRAAERIHFTGRLEHDDLPLLCPPARRR